MGKSKWLKQQEYLQQMQELGLDPNYRFQGFKNVYSGTPDTAPVSHGGMYAVPPFDPVEAMDKAMGGGDMQVHEENVRPYEYMSDTERDQVLKDVLGADAMPMQDYLKEISGGTPTKEEKSRWLEIMRRIGK